jgi:sugar lactone lactonase YvrE
MRIPLGVVSGFLLLSLAASAQQYTISTIAGGFPPPTPVTALNAPIGTPGAVTSDVSGNLYFIAFDCVLRLDVNGTLTQVAGNSRIGFSGDGGPATSAQLYNPSGLAVDSANNLFIADSGNNRIRKVTLPNDTITTIAGNGTASWTGDNGPASAATLNNPQGLGLDSSGNLYIADSGNQIIRKITTATGSITTVAGSGVQGNSGDGSPATSAQVQLNTPMGVAVDALLNIYISDTGNNKIRVVRSGIMGTIAGNGQAGFSGDGNLATLASLNAPIAVAVDTTQAIYFTDSKNFRVRKITPNGVIVTLAGGGGPVSTPSGIAVDPNNNLYIGDSSSYHLLKYTPSGSSTIVAGNGLRYYLGDNGPAAAAQFVQPQGIALDPSGLIVYIADRGEARIRKFQGGTISTPPGATALGPAGVVADASQNLYIADAAGNEVLRVAAGTGAVTLVAGTGTAGSSGDNGIATSAQLNQPSGVLLDSAGNIYIADTGNNRIRKINAAGIITTIVGISGAPLFTGDGGLATNASVNQPAGLAMDSAGDLFIADTGNNRIRKVNPAGIITTVAGNGSNSYSGDGGPATSAGIVSPHGIAVDTRGNLFIPDFSSRIRRVSISGFITTIAGTSTPGYSGDGGPALSAQLGQPWGIAVDMGFNLFVSDVGEQAIRLLSYSSAAQPLAITSPMFLPIGTVGTPYAQSLTATGGTPPYGWSIPIGSLPAGLTLSPTGSITGTPTSSGSFQLTFQVTDSASLTQTATLVIVISPANAGGLAITTPPTMVPGAVGMIYSQALTAIAGNPPYSWALTSGSPPPGLTLFANGLITGVPTTAGTATFTIRVTDNSGTVASQNFTLAVISPGTLVETGALGHIAVGGTWTTRTYITNVSTSPVALNLVYHADDGTALTLPLSVSQQGGTQQITTSTFAGVLNPNTALVIDSGSSLPSTVTGWIDVLSSGAPTALQGYAIFRTTLPNNGASEGTTQLQNNVESKMDLPFDNTGGFVTGVAVANLSSSGATVTATVLDLNGNQIGTYSLQLNAYGHTSFLFPTQFAVSANLQGIVQFSNTNGGNLAGVGLRASTTTGTFTSIPVILP